MSLTLVATPGAADANAYCTVSEGNAYHETQLYASVWNAATDERKAQGLVWATRLLDTHVTWDGSKASTTQALRWPRFGMEDADGYAVSSVVIPQSVKDATAELARQLLTTDPNAAAASGALKSLKVGSIALEYADGETGQQALIPESVAAMLQPFGTVRGAATATLMDRV